MEKPSTRFILYTGLRTIGGVNASVSYGRDRVLLECGGAYDHATAVYDGKILERRRRWIYDGLRAGLMPRVEGLYRREDLFDLPLTSAEDSPWNTAVFITHLHLDHMAYMGAVAPEIPVYLHPAAQKIEAALEATGRGVPTVGRNYQDLLPGAPIRVGQIEVLPILCRDTGYRDFAFLITTPDGTIHWTGDLCLHGMEAERTFRQADLLKERSIDVMLCDCTAFMDSVLPMTVPDKDPKKILPSREVPPGMLSEQAYYEGLFTHLEKAAGLAVFNFYQRETDDAALFMDWARRTGRKCVFEPDAAYIVWKFFGIRPYVYYPDDALTEGQRREAWGRELVANSQEVTPEDIARDPRGYLLQNSYEHIMELWSLPAEKGVYLHADGIPIGAFDPAYANMRRIVERTGFAYVTFFCENYFGHGYPAQVKWFVDHVDPKVLIPCHGYNPERLLPNTGVQLLPELNKEYILCDHKFYPAEKGARQ